MGTLKFHGHVSLNDTNLTEQSERDLEAIAQRAVDRASIATLLACGFATMTGMDAEEAETQTVLQVLELGAQAVAERALLGYFKRRRVSPPSRGGFTVAGSFYRA